MIVIGYYSKKMYEYTLVNSLTNKLDLKTLFVKIKENNVYPDKSNLGKDVEPDVSHSKSFNQEEDKADNLDSRNQLTTRRLNSVSPNFETTKVDLSTSKTR